MRITYLGNCSNQTEQYEATNLVVEAGGQVMLVDTGPGVVQQMLAAGYDFVDIDTILITHSHADHTAGFPYAMFQLHSELLTGTKKSDPIRVVATDNVYEGVMETTVQCYPPDGLQSFETEHTAIPNGERMTFGLGKASVTTCPVEHTVETFGLRIEHEDAAFSYSADTVYTEEFVNLATGSDAISHEAMAPDSMSEMMEQIKHGTAREAGQAAADAEAPELLLHHLLPQFRRDYMELVREASEEYDGKIMIPDQHTTFTYHV